MLAMRFDRGPQLLDSFLPCSGSGDDRLLPGLVLALRRQRQHRPQLGRDPLVPLQVRLVHHEDVRDLQDPGLDHLHTVAEVRGQHDHGRVRHRGHLQLGLADAHRLEDHRVKAEGPEQPDRLARGQRQPAQVPARPHAPDENLRVERVPLHADAVAQDGPSGERRVRVGRYHRHRPLALSQQGDECVHQRRLACARRAGEAHHVGRLHTIAERLLQLADLRIAALDHRDGARQGAHVARSKPVR